MVNALPELDDLVEQIDDELMNQFIGMKNWSDDEQRWIGVVIRVELVEGKKQIVVYDVGTAETQVEIGDWIRSSIATRPWEARDAK